MISIKKRRVWKIDKPGALRRLRLREGFMGLLDSRQVRVETKTIGLNFADIFAVTGLYSATPAAPFIPGLEFSGVVSQTGSDVSSLPPGTRVMGVTRFGGYAEYIDIDPHYIHPIPKTWSFQEGAAYLVSALTALYALKYLGDMKEGQRVLIHSAAGGVGLTAMRIAKILGAYPIGTVRSESKRKFLMEQGFNEVLVRSKHFREQLTTHLNNRPLHLALDAIGGRIQKDSFRCLSPTGRLVVYGAASFAPGKNTPSWLKSIIKYILRPRFDPLRLISANKSILGFNLIWLWENHKLFRKMIEECTALNIASPVIGHEYSFEELPAALEKLRSGDSIGKVVVNLSSSFDNRGSTFEDRGSSFDI